jgi:hypothetical protein
MKLVVTLVNIGSISDIGEALSFLPEGILWALVL